MRAHDVASADALATRRLLALQYGARLSAGHAGFRWPSTAMLLAVQDMLWSDMNAIDAGGAHGDAVYRQSYLKQLIRRLEEGVVARAAVKTGDGAEELIVNEDLMEAYASLMASTPTTSMSQPAARTVTYFLPPSESLASASASNSLFPGWCTIRTVEEGMSIARGTTGLKTWEACLRLAGHLILHRDALLSSSSIIELGCGTGLLGTLSACALSTDAQHQRRWRIVLTDLDGPVLEKARQTVGINIDVNTAAADVLVAPLDWLDVQHGEQQACCWLDSQRVGTVLAADVVFDPDLVAPLCAVLRRTLCRRSDNGGDDKFALDAPFALLASTVRNPDTFALLVETLREFGLSTEEMELHTPLVDLRTLKVASSLQEQSGGEQHPPHLLRLLPSLHDDRRDGHVTLLRISASPSDD